MRGTPFFPDPEAALAPVLAALDELGIAAEADQALDTAAVTVPRTDLHERLLRSATEIRRAREREGSRLVLTRRPDCREETRDFALMSQHIA